MQKYSIYICLGIVVFIIGCLVLVSSIANKKFVEKEQSKGKDIELKGEPLGAFIGMSSIVVLPVLWYISLEHMNNILKQNTNPYYVYGVYFILFIVSVLEIIFIRKSKVSKALKFITYSVSSLMIIFVLLLVGLRLYIFYHLSV